MLTLSSDQSLPDKFATVSQIPLIETRFKMASMIITLLNTLKEDEEIEPDKKTKLLVDRFFKYLIQSCTSVDLITLRAKWLLTYGECIQDHLETVRERRINDDCGSVFDNDEFINLIIKLMESIAVYRIVTSRLITDDEKIISVLNNLVDLSNKVVPENTNIFYIEIINQIEVVIAALKQLIFDQAVRQEGQDRSLVYQLRKIRWSMRRYINHHHPTSHTVDVSKEM